MALTVSKSEQEAVPEIQSRDASTDYQGPLIVSNSQLESCNMYRKPN